MESVREAYVISLSEPSSSQYGLGLGGGGGGVEHRNIQPTLSWGHNALGNLMIGADSWPFQTPLVSCTPSPTGVFPQ